MRTTLIRGERYVWSALVLVGWTDGEPLDGNGDFSDYFDALSPRDEFIPGMPRTYRGPDENGCEPIFENKENKQ